MSNIDQDITLRAMDIEDLDLLYRYENDKNVWRVSGTTVPFSRHILRRFIDSAFTDIYQSGQLRLMVDMGGETIGAVDIFDFDPHNQRAGIGVIIFEPSNRGKGYAKESIKQLINYCFSTLLLHQIYCNIQESNIESQKLFLSLGFATIGTKVDWLRSSDGFENEIMLQLVKQ